VWDSDKHRSCKYVRYCRRDEKSKQARVKYKGQGQGTTNDTSFGVCIPIIPTGISAPKPLDGRKYGSKLEEILPRMGELRAQYYRFYYSEFIQLMIYHQLLVLVTWLVCR
jgi:hypothetical protein